jgi:hypothetical protein
MPQLAIGHVPAAEFDRKPAGMELRTGLEQRTDGSDAGSAVCLDIEPGFHQRYLEALSFDILVSNQRLRWLTTNSNIC